MFTLREEHRRKKYGQQVLSTAGE